MNGFWFSALVAHTLGALSYFTRPVQQWLELGIIPFFAMVLGMWLCYGWSRLQTKSDLPLAIMVCCSMLGFAWVCRYPAFVEVTELNEAARILFALVPNFTLALLFSWRGFVFGSGLAIIFLVSQHSPWQFYFGINASLSFSGIGVLFYYAVAELQRTYSKLEQAATTDSLTQLRNRRALRQDFADSHHFVYLTIWDLNGLKAINDHQGHEAGDAYLLEFSQCLKESVATLGKVYRIGGDEFVACLQELPEIVIARVRQRFAGVAVGGVKLEALTLDEALHLADMRMYEDKRSLGNSRVASLEQ